MIFLDMPFEPPEGENGPGERAWSGSPGGNCSVTGQVDAGAQFHARRIGRHGNAAFRSWAEHQHRSCAKLFVDQREPTRNDEFSCGFSPPVEDPHDGESLSRPRLISSGRTPSPSQYASSRCGYPESTNSSMPTAWYSSIRSATSVWLPTNAVPAPPRTSPTPAHSPGWTSNWRASEAVRPPCRAAMRRWPTDSLFANF